MSWLAGALCVVPPGLPGDNGFRRHLQIYSYKCGTLLPHVRLLARSEVHEGPDPLGGRGERVAMASWRLAVAWLHTTSDCPFFCPCTVSRVFFNGYSPYRGGPPGPTGSMWASEQSDTRHALPQKRMVSGVPRRRVPHFPLRYNPTSGWVSIG